MNTRSANKESVPTGGRRKDEELINEVYLRPCIYDKKDANHGNKEFMTACWDDIGAAINMTALESRRRWINIRDYFRKVLKVEWNGQSALRKTRWYLFDNMQFLIPHLNPLKSLDLDTSENIDIDSSYVDMGLPIKHEDSDDYDDNDNDNHCGEGHGCHPAVHFGNDDGFDEMDAEFDVVEMAEAEEEEERSVFTNNTSIKSDAVTKSKSRTLNGIVSSNPTHAGQEYSPPSSHRLSPPSSHRLSPPSSHRLSPPTSTKSSKNMNTKCSKVKDKVKKKEWKKEKIHREALTLVHSSLSALLEDKVHAENTDDDLLFFKSCVPQLKRLSVLDKLEFRSEVSSLLIKYIRKSEQKK